VAELYANKISLPSARLAAGYGTTFVGVLVLGILVRFLLARLVEGTGLSGTDRLLGMLFGLARGVLVVTVGVFLVSLTALTRDPWWQQSALLPQFTGVAGWLSQQVPSSARRFLQQPTAAMDQLPSLPDKLPDLRLPTQLPSQLPQLPSQLQGLQGLAGGAAGPGARTGAQRSARAGRGCRRAARPRRDQRRTGSEGSGSRPAPDNESLKHLQASQPCAESSASSVPPRWHRLSMTA